MQVYPVVETVLGVTLPGRVATLRSSCRPWGVCRIVGGSLTPVNTLNCSTCHTQRRTLPVSRRQTNAYFLFWDGSFYQWRSELQMWGSTFWQKMAEQEDVFFKTGKRIPLFQIAQTVKQLLLFCDELLTIRIGQSWRPGILRYPDAGREGYIWRA